MPSKRPSPHAMDEGVAAAATPAERLRTSTPRSKKRTSRSKSRARSRSRPRSPNPNPSSHRERVPQPASAAALAPSRKSDRKPKPRYIPDSATLATAIASAAAAAAAPASSGGGGRGSAGAGSKLWTEADEVALLTGAAAFRDRTGILPRRPDMPELFESIRDSLAPHLDHAKMYYKLKRLKSKFQHSAPSDSSTAHGRRVRELCAALWDAELARPVQNDDVEAEEAEEDAAADRGLASYDREGAVRLPVVKEVLGEYWKMNGQGLSGVSLEKGLELLGSQEATVAEIKWRRQLEADMRLQMRRHDLGKEVYGLLIDAIKGLEP